MTTYNTGNTVPSADARDRFDNSQTFDEVSNGLAEYYTNRVGSQVLSLFGMGRQFDVFMDNSESAFTTALSNIGYEAEHLAYVPGSPLVVSRPTQLIDYLGSVYGVKPPASFPVTLTGTWATDQLLLIDRADQPLRTEVKAYFKTSVNRVVASIAELRLVDPNNNAHVFVTSHLPGLGKGGGCYELKSSGTEDYGLTVIGLGGAIWGLVTPHNVFNFGAYGDNVNDDTLAFNRYISALKNKGGGRAIIPESDYRTTGPILNDYSGPEYSGAGNKGMVNIIGDGAGNTNIYTDGGSYAAYSYVGNSSNNTAHSILQGIRFWSTSRVTGGTGLAFNKAAFFELHDVIVEHFDTAVNGLDFEQIGVYNCLMRFNNRGVIGSTGVMTSPNSWSFYNTTVSNNTQLGLYIRNANAFNWNGGSIQYNGVIGGGTGNYGILLEECGNGYGTVGFYSMVFEGNGGLGDLVSGQNTNPCNIVWQNVSFLRTVSFYSTTIIGTGVGNGGSIRLTVDSTAGVTGFPKLAVWGVGGTVEANNAIPWDFVIVDATHIDLVGSTFVNAYTSGGHGSVVGFGDHNILIDGSAINCIYTPRSCTFLIGYGYLPSSSRKSIAMNNVNAKIADDGTNYFQSSIEKFTYTQSQQIGDDGSAYGEFTPVASVGSGTFAATLTGRVKKVGKTVHFQIRGTVTAFSAPGAPLTLTLPFPSAADYNATGMNLATVSDMVGLIGAGLSNIRIWKENVFPLTANGQNFSISGTYETTA